MQIIPFLNFYFLFYRQHLIFILSFFLLASVSFSEFVWILRFELWVGEFRIEMHNISLTLSQYYV